MSDWHGDERRASSLGLLERIHSLETLVSNLTIEVREKRKAQEVLIQEIGNLVKEHHGIIYGTEFIVGLKEEVHYLKNESSQRRMHLNVLTGAVIVGTVNAVFQFIKRIFY